MQTTRRWTHLSSSPAERSAEVSSDHFVCCLAGAMRLRVADGTFYRLFPAMTHTLQTLQMKLSSSPNAPWIWISLSQGWEFLSWNSTLLCFGLPLISISSEFLPPLGTALSKETAPQDFCAVTTLQTKATYTQRSLLVPHEVAGKSCNLQGLLVLENLCHLASQHLRTFVESPHDARWYFSTTDRCWLSWIRPKLPNLILSWFLAESGARYKCKCWNFTCF